MSAVVIDTNVLLVADGKAGQMTSLCAAQCAHRLEAVRTGGIVVLDQSWLILNEYQNKLNASGRPPTPGNLFLEWLLSNRCNSARVAHVVITPTNAEKTEFVEFPPDSALVSSFDPADRKFVAVAYAHHDKPPIVECADSKWLGWEAALLRHGIRLEVLCRCELETIRRRKTAAVP